jgi:E3 ubiquitin-protein ligase HUWE1
MGFPEKLVKKAIKRVEIPEPTMIIDMLCNGRISDDEDE